MQVRGAPLIGVAAAYGMALAMAEDPSDCGLDRAIATLAATRPTAVNLRWALAEMDELLRHHEPSSRFAVAITRAGEIAEADVASSRAIGEHGAALIAEAWRRRGNSRPVEVLTHRIAGCCARSIGARHWLRSIGPMMTASRSTSGSTRRGRAIRAPG